MKTGLILLAAAATLGTTAIAAPASAQYHHGYGYHHGYHRDWGYRHHWRAHRWHHRYGYRHHYSR